MVKKVLIVDDVAGWIRFHENNIKYINNNIHIDTADSAILAISKIEASIDSPYSTIFTDLQMEANFLPKPAGQWLIEQIKMFDVYNNSNIVIISASDSISSIAKNLDVNYISKFDIRNATSDIYKQYL